MNENLLPKDQQIIKEAQRKNTALINKVLTQRDVEETTHIIALATHLLSKIVEDVPDKSLSDALPPPILLSIPPAALESEDPDAALIRRLDALQSLDQEESLISIPPAALESEDPDAALIRRLDALQFSGIESLKSWNKATLTVQNIKNLEDLDKWILQLKKNEEDFSKTLQTCNWYILYLIKKPTGDRLLCADDSSINLLRDSLKNDKWYYKVGEMGYILLVTQIAWGQSYFGRTKIGPQSIFVSLETAKKLIKIYDRQAEEYPPDKISLLTLEYDKTVGALPPSIFRGYGNIQHRNINVYKVIN